MSVPALLTLIVLVAGVLGGAGAWRVQAWRHAAQERDRIELQAEQRRQRERGVDTAAAGHEQDRAQIRTEYVTITQEVERVIAQDPHAAAGCLDADGLRVLADAIGGAGVAGQPAAAVPRPAPAE